MDIYKEMSHIATGAFIARAMLDDYAALVSRIEGTDPEVVKSRIMAQVKTLADEAIARLQPPEKP